jgi:hypothetical protein
MSRRITKVKLSRDRKKVSINYEELNEHGHWAQTAKKWPEAPTPEL